MIDSIAAHPVMVQPDAEKVVRAVIAGGRLRNMALEGQTEMDEHNHTLYSFVGASAKALLDFQQPITGEKFATDLRDAFLIGSYIGYQVISMELDFKTPEIDDALLKSSLEQAPKAAFRGHEWHFAVHSNPVLRTILEHLNTRFNRPTLQSQNAAFNGGGLVSYAINDHIARLN